MTTTTRDKASPMTSAIWFNAHRHGTMLSDNERAIVNYQPGVERAIACLATEHISVGLHPWRVDATRLSRDLSNVATFGATSAAIGEIGLDRVKGAPWDLQEQAFERQLEIAERVAKPVIIHCVRAYAEILSFRKRFHQTPWVIHGFHGKPALARQLLDKGCHVSFGQTLLAPSPALADALKAVELDRLFLETDTSDARIDTLYQAAADILAISPRTLRLAIWENARRVFGVNVNVSP